MREAWRQVELGDLCDIALGGTPARKTARFWDVEKKSGNVWLSIADIPKDAFSWIYDSKEYLSNEGAEKVKLVRQGTLLFSFKLSIGRVCFAGQDLRTNEAIAALSIKSNAEVDKRYIAWFLWGQDWNEIAANDEKLKGKTLNKEKLKRVPVDVPPMPEQKRIVAILDEAFAGIDTAIANTEKNLLNARNLFESYLHSVFDKKAYHWRETRVGQLVEEGTIEKPMDGNHGEIHPKKADFVPSGIPFIMAYDLVGGSVNQTDCNFIAREQAGSLRKGFAFHGDVLLSHKGTIGRSAILDTDLDYVMLTPQVTYYRVKDPETLTNRFLYYAFQSPQFLYELKRFAGEGSTRAYIGITKQLKLPLVFPPKREQDRYSQSFDDLSIETNRLTRIYKKKLMALSELKQSLLRQAFSGEFTIGKTETEAREATA